MSSSLSESSESESWLPPFSSTASLTESESESWPWRHMQALRRNSSTDYCGNIVVSKIPAKVKSVLAQFYNSYPDNCLVPLHAYLLPGFRAGDPREFEAVSILSRAEGERLAEVVADLDRAISIRKIRTSCHTKRGTRLAQHVQNAWCHGARLTSPGHFEFYIAGGYAVDTILGYGPHTDIDVWFEPRMKETPSEWLVVTAKSCYPTSIIMVNDVRGAIETFDLHICQCAVKCAVYRGKRHYSVHLTRNCAKAWLYREVTVTPLHPAVSQPWKLGARLHKYAARNLSVPRDMLALAQQKPNMNCDEARALKILDGMSLADFTNYGARWVVTTDGSWIKSCNFELYNRKDQRRHSRTVQVSSLPVIVYPCHQSESWLEIAYKRGELHWLLRSLASSRSVVGLRGGGSYDCALVKPLWLVERRRLSVAEVIADMKRELPVKTNVSPFAGISQYVIYCDFPVSVLLMTVDWKLIPNTRNSYVPTSIMLMDLPGPEMQTCMFCATTLQFCSECEHGYGMRIVVY